MERGEGRGRERQLPAGPPKCQVIKCAFVHEITALGTAEARLVLPFSQLLSLTLSLSLSLPSIFPTGSSHVARSLPLLFYVFALRSQQAKKVVPSKVIFNKQTAETAAR